MNTPLPYKTLLSSDGRLITLGSVLGRGGEGTVYSILESDTLVAKIYHQPLTASKQAKLTYMVEHQNQDLLTYAAWPQATLKADTESMITGFLMQKIEDKEAIHHIYSPAHRKQTRPELGWDFLIFVARNIAQAFYSLHKHHHILGDINQGNVLVGANSQVMLIDTDSFQIQSFDEVYRCEVGVAHFTPPELQNVSRFSEVERTANHDNFGLALLIFHLLMGGRHPFAGVPQKAQVGEALENDVQFFRYAYAHDALERGMIAPPHSIPIEILPPSITERFHLAFTEDGVNRRPTALEWVEALDQLRLQLQKCTVSDNHIYTRLTSACPWCALENKGISYFLTQHSAHLHQQAFDLDAFWKSVGQIRNPGRITAPEVPVNLAPENDRLGSFWQDLLFTNGWQIALLALLCTAFFFTPGINAYIVTPMVVIIVHLVFEKKNMVRKQIIAAYRTLIETRDTFEQYLTQVNEEYGSIGFLRIKRQLDGHKKEYEKLMTQVQEELENLPHTASNRQLQVYLEKTFLENADIPKISASRKATLQSYGIETAADIEKNRISAIKGFGKVYTQALLDWRSEVEKQFVYSPEADLPDPEQARIVEHRYALQKKKLEQQMMEQLTALEGFVRKRQADAGHIALTLQKATIEHAQAQLNFSIYEIELPDENEKAAT